MRKVLIVEDDKVLSLLLTKMMEKLNMQVIATVTEGGKAISMAKEHNPDLILMDIMLEDDIDGIDAMIAIQGAGIKSPAIFITGNSDSYNRERAEAVDYVDYLVKPISFTILKDSISKIED
ncbi:MAG: response regulator [Balneolaceae bacterium]|nr:response regulator [Balneolaceae bacterium]